MEIFIDQEKLEILTGIVKKYSIFIPVGRLIDDRELFKAIDDSNKLIIPRLTAKESILLQCNYPIYFLRKNNNIEILHCDNIDFLI